MNDKTKDIDRRQEEASTSEVAVSSQEKLYLLVEGQKSGPFSKDEVASMVESREVLVTDSVSVNGQEWFSLHQWSEFDRRSAHSEELPGLPKVNTFIESDKEVDDNLISKSDMHVEREVIAGLAYIGNINSGKKAQHHKDKYVQNEGITDTPPSLPDMEPLSFDKQKTSKDTYIWGAVLSFALAGIIYLFVSPSPSKKVASANSIQIKTVTKRSPAARRAKSAAKKANKRPVRNVVKARKRTPSFAKSKAFKNRAPRRKPASRKIQRPVVEDPDDYYYDDGTDPVELDPIRSKLAKETFDPEDDEGIDGLEDEYNAEREPASGDSVEEDPEKAFEALYE